MEPTLDHILIFDGDNLLIRAIKATEHAGLQSDGVATGALLAFINSLTRYVRLVEPTHVAVCWDDGHDHRTALDGLYKAHRTQTRHDHTPFILSKQFLSLAGVHHISYPGVEADDIIAGYWLQRDPSAKFSILSGDKDFLQLLDRNCTLIRPGTGFETWVSERVESEFGCLPQYLPYVMALAGDDIDGVPGVKGVGIKTAVKVLDTYGWSLDRVLATEKYGVHKDRVHLNLDLVDLRTRSHKVLLPSVPRFTPTENTSLLWQELMNWLQSYEMRTIVNRLLAGTLWKSS